MEKILPPDFVTYLYEYTRRQNAARFSINETAVLCGVALTVDSKLTHYTCAYTHAHTLARTHTHFYTHTLLHTHLQEWATS